MKDYAKLSHGLYQYSPVRHLETYADFAFIKKISALKRFPVVPYYYFVICLYICITALGRYEW